MSDREIMNAKAGVPMWWRPNKAYLREEWTKHSDLKKFINKKCTDSGCECEHPYLVELWEHDSCVRGRIDTKVCVKCDEIHSFSIIR